MTQFLLLLKKFVALRYRKNLKICDFMMNFDSTKGFMVFPGVIKWEHWSEMSYIKSAMALEKIIYFCTSNIETLSEIFKKVVSSRHLPAQS